MPGGNPGTLNAGIPGEGGSMGGIPGMEFGGSIEPPFFTKFSIVCVVGLGCFWIICPLCCSLMWFLRETSESNTSKHNEHGLEKDIICCCSKSEVLFEFVDSFFRNALANGLEPIFNFDISLFW